MLLRIKKFRDIDGRRLMDIYHESNTENIFKLFPEYTGQSVDLRKVEQVYLQYLKKEFFSKPENSLYLLEKSKVWVSAVRIYQIHSGVYYEEALETHPDYRGRGYAEELMHEVTETLADHGSFELHANISGNNTASLQVHRNCGFKLYSNKGYDYLENQALPESYGAVYQYLSQN